MRTAFITGSTGFVGLNLIEELCTSTGHWHIHALVLPEEDTRHLVRFNVSPVVGNILDRDSLRKAIPEGVDVIFHVAGDTSMWNKHNDRQYGVNVIGTNNMVGAAIEKNAGRFVHTSSISAYGHHPMRIISEKTESNALTCAMNYNKTKFLAEQEVKKGVSVGLNAIILNPCNIVGPYDRVNWAQAIKGVYHGALRGVPPGLATFSHARDIVKAHIAAVDKGGSGENYILGGIEATFKEVFNEIERLLGKKPSDRVVSRSELKLAMYWFEIKSLIDRKEPALTPAKYNRLVGHQICDDGKARRELGFSTGSLNRMLTDSYNWLIQEDLLNG